MGAARDRHVKHPSARHTDHEFDLIVFQDGARADEVELAVFSLMWSEH